MTRRDGDLAEHSQFLRAAGLMAATSALVPIVGVATAPVLAHGLGVDGRGASAAALAPGVLIVGGATLGLPEALTYLIAKDASRARALLARSALMTGAVGAAAFAAVALLAVPLGGGVPGLPALIFLGTALSVPQLLVGLLRGIAIGEQRWRTVALERSLSAFARLLLLVLLLAAGWLTVVSAVVVTALVPVAAGLVYLRRTATVPGPAAPTGEEGERTGLLHFGVRLWTGSIAGIVISRLGPLLVTPLSDVGQLGLLVVAVTVADVPFIVSTSVRDVLFGADSRRRDAGRLAATTRSATGIALLGSLVLGVTLPVWIVPVFGSGFAGAVPTCWILLAATVCNVPGWMAGAGLSAWGRPGLRSAGLVLALVVNLAVLLALVPLLGAEGAAIAALVGGIALSAFTVILTARTVRTPVAALIVPGRSDAVAIVNGLRAVLGRAARRSR